ncbi:CHAT domain-containing protein [Solirubrobacter pauli]|uniref:CHAT domain-containing protein n=1 Tax=Solirubrobacter pauli TaxID=166793 RepID=A0A660L8L0_9ACTN|nr:CHAT domain-containing protein [Solirubrobacter pauli]RKQ91348.1 CHAT domain-containing protein [Solirubrobacter pauli]
MLAVAEEAVRLASADARAARRAAAAVVAETADVEARSVAERALGLAALELGDPTGAVAHLQRARALAVTGDLKTRIGEADMSLALALTLLGDTAQALACLDRAEPVLDGHLRARAQGQRALVLQKLGRLDEALAGYRRPLRAHRAAGDTLWEARLLCNRGVLQIYRGALAAAEADLARAERLHESIGQALAATQVRHNRGWLAARSGDVPRALKWYDRVEAEYRDHGVPLALLLMDRCEVLLSARLAAEAKANADAAATELAAAGFAADLAEAHLLAAHAELLVGDTTAAREHATRADQAFTRQRRPGWAALARAATAEAAWLEATRANASGAASGGAGGATGAGGPASAGAAGPASAGVAGPASAGVGDTDPGDAAPVDAGRRERLEGALVAAQRAVRALERVGWDVEALDARLIAGRAALALGRERLARRYLGLAAARRDRGPVQVRTRAAHAAALLRLAQGDRRGASAAVAAGLRALEAHQMALGATELRAHASGHGEALATLGLRLAVESGSAQRVLVAAERRRAAGLLRRPARPPDDAALAHELQELRRTTSALEAGLRDGQPEAELRRRQASLERSVRRRALQARWESGDVFAPKLGGVDPVPSIGELSVALGERDLVEFVALDDELLSVTVADGRATLRRLASATEVAKEVASLRFALRRLATAPPGSRTAQGMADVAATVAARLDALLGLADAGGERPLVIVPTGDLHALPWAMVPSLERRALTVCPSVRLWYRAALVPAPRAPRHVLVAGPRLPAATEEVEALARRHPEATTLTHARATVGNVTDALSTANTAHIAAHGRFRDDNPQFCSLELADGNVTVYDLERVPRLPQRIVLASCESGLSAVHAGDELMGFTAAVLTLGTSTVIAAVVPVPDAATKGLMLRLDEALQAGEEPAQALVNARAEGVLMSAGGASFVCFGAG